MRRAYPTIRAAIETARQTGETQYVCERRAEHYAFDVLSATDYHAAVARGDLDRKEDGTWLDPIGIYDGTESLWRYAD
jgi:hypothetical protein